MNAMNSSLLEKPQQSASSTRSEENTLSQEEIKRFHDEGYLGPCVAVTPDAMAGIRNHIDTVVLQKDGPNPKTRLQSRHMDSRVVCDLACHPAIIGRMRSLYGPDLVMWATNFFNKEPGGSEIPWHQDLNYWPLEPLINISAWIAIDDVKIDNSCVQILPGSHKKVVPHIRSTEGMAFGEMADPNFYDPTGLVNMELKPGEFFLFNEKTLHHSEPNRSSRRRMGMSVRVTLPIVRIGQDGPPLHPGHAALLASGRDTMGFNRLMEKPQTP
jgi:ectoine hydroxylase-related dioxygenase (phytanoyl-CoA dioxygenase family)